MVVPMNRDYNKILTKWKFQCDDYAACKRFLYIQEIEGDMYAEKNVFQCVLVNISSLIGRNDKVINLKEEESNVNVYFGTYTKIKPDSQNFSRDDLISIKTALYNMTFNDVERHDVKSSLSNILLGYDHSPFADPQRSVISDGKVYDLNESDPYPQYFRFSDQIKHGKLDKSFTNVLLENGVQTFTLNDLLIDDDNIMHIEKVRLKSLGFNLDNGVFGHGDQRFGPNINMLIYGTLTKLKRTLEDHGFRSGSVIFHPKGFNILHVKSMMFSLTQEELDFKAVSLELCIQNIYTFDYSTIFGDDKIKLYFNMTPQYNDVEIAHANTGMMGATSNRFHVTSCDLVEDILEQR